MYFFETVIVAHGELPYSNKSIEILQNAQNIVCCDGAIDILHFHNIEPHAIVGDLDSIHSDDLKKYKKIIHKDNSQEYNDLQKAIHFCFENNWLNIVILSGFGKREDHSLANLSIMLSYIVDYQKYGVSKPKMAMVTNFGVFTPITETTTFQSFPKQQVSIFSFDKSTELTFTGLKYPVQKRAFRHLWEGSLNEAIGDQFTIEMERGEVIVFQTS